MIDTTTYLRSIVIAAILLAGSAQGQRIRLETKHFVKDDAFEKSQSILPVYKHTSDSIEPYTQFGVDPDPDQKWYKIKKYPEMLDSRDTAYTYIYFAGADNPVSKGYLLTLIGNYRRSSSPIYFYVDRNNDFDFTNDGPPDTLRYNDNDIDITLHNKDIPEATYRIRLSRFQYGENLSYKSLLNTHYRNHSGKKVFTTINYCYRTQRYNCISADYISDTDSFTIGVKDMNVNGIYNESCNDLLYVGRLGSQILSDDLKNVQPDLEDNVFEWNGKMYRIAAIETTGAFIEIEEVKEGKLTKALRRKKKVPNFTYFNVFNVEHELSEFRRQQVYVYFWNKESIQADDTMYIRKLHQEYGQELKVITLNHGDAPRQVKVIFYFDHIEWPMGYSNEAIADLLMLEDLPRGYYLGKRRKLIDDRISPKELYEQLSQAK